MCKSVTVMASLFSSHRSQASQLGVYKAFVDNYKEAVETAEKCSHANIQFQEISEVSPQSHIRLEGPDVDLSVFTTLEKSWFDAQTKYYLL